MTQVLHSDKDIVEWLEDHLDDVVVIRHLNKTAAFTVSWLGPEGVEVEAIGDTLRAAVSDAIEICAEAAAIAALEGDDEDDDDDDDEDEDEE